MAYLKSVPATRNQVEPPVYKAPMEVHIPPGAEKPFSDADMDDPVKRGFYLATIGHCMECHTKTPSRHRLQEFARQGRRGVQGPVGRLGRAQHHVPQGKGHRRLDRRADQGRDHARASARTARQLKPPMGYDMYATMTEPDLSAIVAYLRTVPPKE